MKRIGWTAIWLAVFWSPAHGSDVSLGREVAQQWCSACHAETRAQTGVHMEVPFEEIAIRPWIDASRLRAFLDEDHFPMTTFRLFPEEKDAVTAYLLVLRSRQLDQ